MTYFCNSNGYSWLGSPEWAGTPPQTSCPAVDATECSSQCFYLPGWLFSLEVCQETERKTLFYPKRHAYLSAEGSGWLQYLLLYWTPLAKRLCRLWFMDCRPAGMFLSRSCPGSDPTSFLNAENILTLFHRRLQNHAMLRWKSPDSWSHSERRNSRAEEVTGPCSEANTMQNG